MVEEKHRVEGPAMGRAVSFRREVAARLDMLEWEIEGEWSGVMLGFK